MAEIEDCDKVICAKRAPTGVPVEEGKTYYWCTCGRSAKQPFCDGSHKGTSFRPSKYTATETKKAYFCNCKMTQNPPMCDGSHAKLPEDAEGKAFKPFPKLKLTYFNIQGVAERIRLAYVLAGLPFEDDRINFSQWGELKPTTPYGQLPTLTINDGEPIAQSLAMSMLAAEYCETLYPNDAASRLKVNEVLGLAGDLDKSWTPCLYMGMMPQKFGYPEGSNRTKEGKERTKKLRENFAAGDLRKFLEYYTKLLNKTGAFFCGDKPTLADCHILPQLRAFTAGHIDYVPTDCLNDFPVVVAWIARMLEHPLIKKYYANRAKIDAAAKAAAAAAAPAPQKGGISPTNMLVTAAAFGGASWKLGLAACVVMGVAKSVKKMM